MKHEAYFRFKHEEMILRDFLAADRTVLANERTFLSYIRTALAFAGGGIALIHFLDIPGIDMAGIALIVVSILTLVWGAWRYFQVKHKLDRLI
jgi:putative membrane protein